MMTEIPLVKVQEVPSQASTLHLFIQKMLQIGPGEEKLHKPFSRESSERQA